MGKQQEMKWKDQTKTPSFLTHLLPSKSDPQIKGVPTAVGVELQAYVDQARVRGMEQIDDLVYYDSNSDASASAAADDGTFHDTIQVEDVIEDTNDEDATFYGEPINNEFLPPFGQENGAIGVTIEHERVLYAQYCHCWELYY